jgi:hypothetical protein
MSAECGLKKPVVCVACCWLAGNVSQEVFACVCVCREQRSNYLRAAAEKRQQSEKKSGALASQYVITYEILS